MADVEKIQEYCFLGFQWWGTCMQKSEWASWIQAIGSIMAIAAAAWVVQRTHTLEKRREARKILSDRRATFESVFQLVGGVHQIAQQIETAMQVATPNVVSLEVGLLQLEGFKSAFARADHLKYDAHVIIEALLSTEGVTKMLMDDLGQLAQSMKRSPGHSLWGQAMDAAAAARAPTRKRMDALHAEIDTMSEQLRAMD